MTEPSVISRRTGSVEEYECVQVSYVIYILLSWSYRPVTEISVGVKRGDRGKIDVVPLCLGPIGSLTLR